MFDMGFAELLIVGLVALLVLGPERLPKVARTVGYWGGRARGYMRQITNELEREVRQSEIRETIEKARATMNTKVDLDAATRDADEPPPASPDAAPPPASASPPDRERGA
ncbi:MAG: Sec-independent protein translocase protein TatB [Oceanococcaceae bacterium]